MKKMIALLLAALMICAMFTGCGEKGTTLKSVQKAGKLTIATSPDFPPFESLGDNNEVVGIEIDVLNLICEQLGVTLEINQMDFDSVLPGVQAGKFDVGVSGISVTEKRQKTVLFTDPYCLAAQAIVVTEGSSITCVRAKPPERAKPKIRQAARVGIICQLPKIRPAMAR